MIRKPKVCRSDTIEYFKTDKMQKMEKVILKSLLKETTLAKYLKGIENHQLNVELPSGKVHFRKLEFNAEVSVEFMGMGIFLGFVS